MFFVIQTVPPSTVDAMNGPRSRRSSEFGELSHTVIGACIDVQRQLGQHCMEVDYQRALELALTKRGLWYQREVEIPIAFDGVVVTRRRVDFVIGDDRGSELLLDKGAERHSARGYRAVLTVPAPGRLPIMLAGESGREADRCTAVRAYAVNRQMYTLNTHYRSRSFQVFGDTLVPGAPRESTHNGFVEFV